MRLFICFCLSIGLLSQGVAQTIAQEQSKVAFEISNMSFKIVEGNFTGMDGNILFDLNDLKHAYFDVCIDAASIDTDNEQRDKHLKGEDFFDVEKYPNICFKSKNISKTQNGFIAKGDLNLHGVTKTIEIPFTFNGKTFDGHFSLQRLDYGVGPKGGFMVGKDVNIQIICKIK